MTFAKLVSIKRVSKLHLSVTIFIKNVRTIKNKYKLHSTCMDSNINYIFVIKPKKIRWNHWNLFRETFRYNTLYMKFPFLIFKFCLRTFPQQWFLESKSESFIYDILSVQCLQFPAHKEFCSFSVWNVAHHRTYFTTHLPTT